LLFISICASLRQLQETMLLNSSISKLNPGSQGRSISFFGNGVSSVQSFSSWSGTSKSTGDVKGCEESGSYRHVDGLNSGKMYIISQGGSHSV